MAARARSIPAAEFKAKCLSLLDEVASTGVPLIVTKRGVAVARVEPIGSEESRDLRGSVVREGDLISPIEDAWSAES